MVATRGSRAGLSPADLERVRATLAAGRRPKVVFTASAGQVAGQVGQVVSLADPTVSDEWLMVRFGRDELPFAPGDLSFPERAARPSAGGGGAAAVAQAEPGPRSVPNPRKESSMSSTSAVSESPVEPAGADSPQRPAGAGRAGRRSAAVEPAVEVAPGAGEAPSVAEAAPAGQERVAGGATRKAARKAPRARVEPTLTVVLEYADGEWLVSATRGGKALAKPYVVRAAEAVKMASMVDVPGVREAVEEIVSVAREEARTRAERLRAELAEAEARLAELRDDER